MSRTWSSNDPGAGGALVSAVGGLLIVVAVALYVSGLSRAGGVVAAAVGVLFAPSGLLVCRAGRWPHRWVMIAVAVVLALLTVYGVGLYVYGLMHPPLLM